MRMILRVTIGTILMITAILKLHMVVTDPFADLKIGYPFTVIWLVILFEVMIASVNFLVKEFVLVCLSDFSFSLSCWCSRFRDGLLDIPTADVLGHTRCRFGLQYFWTELFLVACAVFCVPRHSYRTLLRTFENCQRSSQKMLRQFPVQLSPWGCSSRVVFIVNYRQTILPVGINPPRLSTKESTFLI